MIYPYTHDLSLFTCMIKLLYSYNYTSNREKCLSDTKTCLVLLFIYFYLTQVNPKVLPPQTQNQTE